MQGPVGKLGRNTPVDANCKIKAGRAPVHRAGKLIAPNNILIFIDLQQYVSSFASGPGFSPSHCQAHGNIAPSFGIADKCRFLSLRLFNSV